jgi:hypothetical protein
VFVVVVPEAPTPHTFDIVLIMLVHLCSLTMGSSFGNVEISPIQKATDIVSHFQSSSQATEKLIRAQSLPEEYSGKNPVGLFTDCKTRWWSTYKMCERILYLKSALHILEASNDIPVNKRLSEVDWEQLKSVAKVLKPF